MEFEAVLSAIAKRALLPPASLVLLFAVGVALLHLRPRLARGILIIALASLYLLCTPIVAAWLQTMAGSGQPVDAARLKSGQAIVILGGGLRLHAPEYGGDTLGGLTLERVRYGARLARSTGLPVLVTGGKPPGADRTEADVMRDALEQEFGVAVRWVEGKSINTAGSARMSAELLRPAGVTRIVLVMHGFDVDRATAEFTDAGLEVIAAPTLLPRPRLDRLTDVLPQAGALQLSYFALYELAGRLARPLR